MVVAKYSIKMVCEPENVFFSRWNTGRAVKAAWIRISTAAY